MRPHLCWVLLVLTVSAPLTGCALLRSESQRPALVPSQGVTYVADGSGDLRQVSDGLANVAKQDQTGMTVQRVQWSHGKGAVFPDLYGAENHQAQGQALANQIVAYRRANPNSRICLVGYSSGASVVLAAAEKLPPQTLNRIILLSPTVSARHDLRPALQSSREGIDAFHSEWDAICLVLFAVGTGDGVGQTVAGRNGFVPVGNTPRDEQLYQGLRQHFWQGADKWQGHDGSHFGCFSPQFLRVQVLPLTLGKQ